MDKIIASLVLLLAAGFPGSSSSQERLQGTIVDETGKPLEGVVLKATPFGIEEPAYSAVSVAEGRFELDVPGVSFIRLAAGIDDISLGSWILSPLYTGKGVVVRKTLEEEADIEAADPRQAKLVGVFAGITRARNALSTALRRHRQSGKPLREFRWNPPQRSMLERELSTQSEPILRQALFYAYLDLGFGAYGASLDPRLCTQALEEIPRQSTLWSGKPDLIEVAVRCQGHSKLADGYVSAVIAYVSAVIADHRDERVQAMVRNQLGPNRTIRAGQPIPDFEFKPLDGVSKGTVSREDLLGKAYLIDFWFINCSPCIDEMDSLHFVHQRYKEQGFEIVSLSWDESQQAVQRFTQERWKMPWRHAWIPQEDRSAVMEKFELWGFPKPILVDQSGIIVGEAMAIRGHRLEEAVAQLLDR